MSKPALSRSRLRSIPPCIVSVASLAIPLAATPASGLTTTATILMAQARGIAADAPSDWPSWRGPGGDGISAETGFLKTWPREGLKELWRIELGSGFSSFAAVGDRLYTLTQRGGNQEVVCLEAPTGRVVWSHALEGEYRERQGGDGPRATPTVVDGVVYALGAKGSLAAIDAATGKPTWKCNVLEKFAASAVTWGLSASPFVDGDNLIVPVGASSSPVVAFDRTTGEVKWRSGTDGQGDLAGYSTPCAITHRGERQILVFLGRSLVSLDPDRGKVLWKYYWKTDFDVNAAAPIYHEGRVFISSGYGHGSALLEVPDKKGGFPREVWKSNVLENKFSSCTLYRDHLYGFDNTALKCVEFKTGEEKWSKRGFGFGSFVLADGHLIVLGDSGTLALARADPSDYVEVARMEGVLTGRSWTVPVLYRGTLYLRNLKEAVALSLKAE